MSWLTDFLRPGDAPRPNPPKRLLEEQPPSTPTSQASDTPSTQPNPNPNRNRVIFAAGLAFTTFSLLITRRAFARRRLSSNPAFYTNAPGHHEQQSKTVSGPIEAVEALSLATINVLSVAMMATGGTLWWLDINSMVEARRFIRGGLGVDGTGRSEQDAEEEFEEWMASTLDRKGEKERRGRVLQEVERAKR